MKQYTQHFFTSPWLAASVVFGIFLLGFGLSTRIYPLISPDEAGILFQAQLLAGVEAGNMWNAPYYHPGTSFLIAPLFQLFDDPPTIYKAVMCLNAILAAAIVPALVYIGRGFGFQGHRYTVAAALLSLWPSYFYVAQYAWAEATFRLGFVLSVILLMQLLYKRTALWAAAFGISVVATYCIHPRALLILPFSFIVILLLAWRKRIQFACVAAYIAGFAVSLIPAIIFMEFAKEALWESNSNSFAVVLSRVRDLNMFDAVTVLFGQLWYQLTSSFGLITIGLLTCFSLLRLRRGDEFFLALYICLAILGVFVASVTQMVMPVRMDQAIYGRYIDGVSILLFWLGLCVCMDYSDIYKRRLALSALISTVIIAVSALIVLVWTDVVNPDFIVPHHVAGIGWYVLLGSTYVQFLFGISSITILVILLWWVLHKPNVILLCVGIVVVLAATKINKYTMVQNKLVGYSLDQYIKVFNDVNPRGIYWTQDTINRLNTSLQDRLQFLLGRHFDLYKGQASAGDIIMAANRHEGTEKLADFNSIGMYVRNGSGLIDSIHAYIHYPIEFGTELKESPYFLMDGWHGLEENHVWSWAEAKLRLPVPADCGSHGCEAVLQFVVFGAGPERPVTVLFNSVYAGRQQSTEIVATNADAVQLHIPLTGQNSRWMEILISIPGATSPKALTGLADDRVLGIAMQRIDLRSSP